MLQHRGMPADELPAALRAPACYPHPAGDVELIETHISWVLLAGEYAYKLKRPVRLPFLDFSTLAARRRYCEEELRLNRRWAPQLYLAVVPVVRGADGGLRFDGGEGAGVPVDYAVRMRRFAAEALGDAMARRGALGAAEVDALAATLARLHAGSPRADAASAYGTPAAIVAPALGNFDQLAALDRQPSRAEREALARLRAWTQGECDRLRPVFTARRGEGRVRECHGDLHLANVAFLEGRAVPFDGIEFDPALRWIDVMSEVAFAMMDLAAHGLPGLAWRLLNGWLEATGDYEGVAVLRFYLVYRAMVRSKIACLRGDARGFEGYLALAESLAAARRPGLVLMHGLSGSGKTTVAQALVERLGAVRLRSDVERKRLHGIADPRVRAAALPGAGIYGAQAGERTYARLAALAQTLLPAGYPVVVDAAFLRRAQRDHFRALARRAGAPFLIAGCRADAATLRHRVAERAARGDDASDADAAVLAHQQASAEALAAEEAPHEIAVGTGSDEAARAGVEAIAARLAPAGVAEAR